MFKNKWCVKPEQAKVLEALEKNYESSIEKPKGRKLFSWNGKSALDGVKVEKNEVVALRLASYSNN